MSLFIYPTEKGKNREKQKASQIGKMIILSLLWNYYSCGKKKIPIRNCTKLSRKLYKFSTFRFSIDFRSTDLFLINLISVNYNMHKYTSISIVHLKIFQILILIFAIGKSLYFFYSDNDSCLNIFLCMWSCFGLFTFNVPGNLGYII